jgi:hypothetical protein
MAACIRMNHMMWDRVTGPGGLLETLIEGRTPPPRGNAQILEFHSGR